MSEKRKIDDAELVEIAGAGKDDGFQEVGDKRPMPPVDTTTTEPETDDQDNGDQNFGG